MWVLNNFDYLNNFDSIFKNFWFGLQFNKNISSNRPPCLLFNKTLFFLTFDWWTNLNKKKSLFLIFFYSQAFVFCDSLLFRYFILRNAQIQLLLFFLLPFFWKPWNILASKIEVYGIDTCQIKQTAYLSAIHSFFWKKYERSFAN